MRTSNDASRTRHTQNNFSKEKTQTDSARRSGFANFSVYLLKQNVSLRLEKIKQTFSTIVHGREHAKATYGNIIRNIKKNINDEKNYLNKSNRISPGNNSSLQTIETSELQRKASPQSRNISQDSQEVRGQTTNSNNRTFIVPPQETIFQQVQPMAVNQQPMPMQQQGFIPEQQLMTPTMAMMEPTIPAYAYSTTLPQQSYFEQGWYTPMPLPVPSYQATLATTTQDRTEDRRLPAARSHETNSRAVRQNCVMGNAPDTKQFYAQVQAEFTKHFSSLDQFHPSQILHALSHTMYSGKIPPYSDEKMKDAVFYLINTIEQLRLDYVPNANDGSPNIYKVIFNNLLRAEIVERLPEALRKDFEACDEEYHSNGDFAMLVQKYTGLIGEATAEIFGSNKVAKKEPQTGQLTSEWMARMNESLAPMREKIEEWSDLEKYQALHHMMNTRILDSITNPKVISWVSEIEKIRTQEVHDADRFKVRNEQKIFFNNNIRLVIRNNLPEDFQKKFNVEFDKFNRLDSTLQAAEYQNFRNAVLAIIENDMEKLQPG